MEWCQNCHRWVKPIRKDACLICPECGEQIKDLDWQQLKREFEMEEAEDNFTKAVTELEQAKAKLEEKLGLHSVSSQKETFTWHYPDSVSGEVT